MSIRARFASAVPWAGALTVVAGAWGCVVSDAKYQSKVDELGACQTDRDSLVTERNKLQNQMPELEARMKEELDATQEELEALREQRAELDKQLEEYENLTQRFQELVSSEGINVDVRRGRMIVSLPSGVLFPSGKADLSQKGAATLTKVAGKLKDFKNRRFIIAGHTDNVRFKKKRKKGQEPPEFADNWELSTARALNVTRFLISQGLSPRNLATGGYAQYDPARSNRNKRNRRFNRRIEIILEPKLPDFRKLARLSQRSRDAGKAKPGDKQPGDKQSGDEPDDKSADDDKSE